MKVIFDTEEQKKAFFNTNIVCPNDLGLDRPKDAKCFDKGIYCERCWKAAGIKVKVKPQIDDDII
jgi:hypothetical protein